MYHRVFVAGTFDRLHSGHKATLTRAFEAGETVQIGLTSDTYISRFKQTSGIRPYEERRKMLISWLHDVGVSSRATIIPIDDPYEPAASDPEGEVLVVTSDNKARGVEVNARRSSRGLPPLTLLEVPLVSAEDNKPISSTRVRLREIDPTGKLIMPESLRPELGLPLGAVLVGDGIGTSIENRRNGIIIAVGDMTTMTILTAGVVPHLTIVDYHVGRKPFPDIEAKLTALHLFQKTIESGPGFIADEAVGTVQKWAKHPDEKMIMVIKGEEDLLTLPAVAYGPIGSVVYYGQPPLRLKSSAGHAGEGVVEVVISADKRQEAQDLLSRFT